MMTTAVREPMTQSSAATNDLRMAMVAGAGVTLSVAAVVARAAGVMPSGAATVIVLIGSAIALKVAFSYVAKAASAPSRARVLMIVSNVGLGISAVTILAALPHLTHTGGFEKFATDLVAQLWGLTVLMVIAGSVRTLNWRAFVGAGTTGFLAVTALATLLGSPVVGALGRSSLLAVSVWVPLTEELCKMIPVAFVVIVALKRTTVRPSALDVMLLGAWTGAGFGLYENATFGRGSFDLSTVPVISLIFPSETSSTVAGSTMVHGGHLIFSALLALGIGLTFLYRNRFKRPELVLLAVVLVALLEHASNNALALAHSDNALLDIALALTLGGFASSLLLIAGIAYAFYIERRAIGAVVSRREEWLQLLRPDSWFKLPADVAQRRSMLLARAQLAPSPSAGSSKRGTLV